VERHKPAKVHWRIATEEAFARPTLAEALRALGQRTWDCLDPSLVRQLYSGKAQASLKTSTDGYPRNLRSTTSGVERDKVVRFCIEQMGADNRMCAIGYPYQTSDSATQWLHGAPIPDGDKANHGNAERIFHIGHRAA
jgi:hypothetical protein